MDIFHELMTVGKNTFDATNIIMRLVSDVKGRGVTTLTERDKKTLKRASSKLNEAQSVIKKLLKENNDKEMRIIIGAHRILIGAFELTIQESVLSDEWTPEQLRLLESYTHQVVYSTMIAGCD